MLRLPAEQNLPTTRAQSGLSLRDIVFVLFRRRWVILSICVPIIVLGGWGLAKQTGSVTATSRVVVELVKADLPIWNASGRNVDYDRELSTLFTIAMSVPVADEAARALRDSIPVIKQLDPRLENLEQGNHFRDFLADGLDVGVVGESAILEFRFASVNARISLMACRALRDAFVDFQVNGRRNTRAVAYYDEQVNLVRAEIDSLLDVRGQRLAAAGYSSLTDELRYDSGQLVDMRSQLFEATVVRRSLQMEYERLAAFLDRDPREFPMGPDENRSITLVHWRNTLAKHEDELNSILTIHTENSIPARRKRELIQESLRSLAREEANYVASLKVSLDAAREKEQALRDLIAEVESVNSKAPAVYQAVSLLDTEINSLRKLLEEIQGKRGEVRLSQFADERVSAVTVLNEPEITSVITSGKTIVYFVLVSIFAVALGIVVAFVLESLDHRIYVPRDVEENLKLPVFASVSKVD